MSYKSISYEVDGQVATVTLDRPDSLNAQTRRMHEEILDAADRWDADDDVRAVIFTGAGKGFSAGTDVKASWGTGAATEPDLPPTYVDGVRRDTGGRLVLRLFESKKPMIAAVNGVAVGIGATFILPMDVRIASESARFGFVFTQRGICPESCSSWFLPRIVGITRALDWINTGRLFPAAEALSSGLVSEVVPSGELLARARAIATGMIERTAPVSVAVSRQLLWKMLGAAHPMEAHEMESQALTELIEAEDAKEAGRAFVEKRAPSFAGRPSTDMPSTYPWWPSRSFTGRIPGSGGAD